jgi:predicted nuclease of predicted toxin-antitoxin system
MVYQIVADESVDFRIVFALRELGFTVFSIAEEQASIRDEEVLRIAVLNNSLLITEDKDFGELVFRLQLAHKGVLLLRLDEKDKAIEVASQTIVKYYPDLLNNFSVLNQNKLRIKQ